MRNVFLPSSNYTDLSFTILPHSVGGQGAGGNDAFVRGGGPYWQGTITFPALENDDAFAMRAAIHALRGSNGSFLFQVPTTPVAPDFSTVDEATRFDIVWGGAALQWGGDGWQWGATATVVRPGPDDAPFDVPTGYEFQALLAADVARYGICLTLSLVPSEYASAIQAGVMLWIGDDMDTGQLVEVVDVDGANIEFRPWLRRDYIAGTRVSVGPVFAKFRLAGDVPYIPLNGHYAESFSFQFTEFY